MIPKLFPNIEDDFFGDNLLSKFFEIQRNLCIPAANVYENPQEYRIEIAAPGMKKSDFSVNVEKKTLTISSDVKKPEALENEKNLRKEFCFQTFKRCFSLPEDSSPSKISASYSEGILTVKVPKQKAEEAKTKEIRIE